MFPVLECCLVRTACTVSDILDCLVIKSDVCLQGPYLIYAHIPIHEMQNDTSGDGVL